MQQAVRARYRPARTDAWRANGLAAGLSVSGEVILANNDSPYYMMDITGLANLAVTASSPSAIRINNNKAIRQCDAEAVIQTLRGNDWGGEAEVQGNASCL